MMIYITYQINAEVNIMIIFGFINNDDHQKLHTFYIIRVCDEIQIDEGSVLKYFPICDEFYSLNLTN